MKKSYLVEGYRFAAAISIMLFHFLKTWSNQNNMRMGVEFFFVLSGFLLMAHLEKHPDESVPSLMMGKLKTLYPGIFVLFWMATICIAILEKKKEIHVMVYQHLHQLLFLTNAFHGKASWLSGTGQLWFVFSQLWATLILAWLVKMHHKSYESAFGALIVLGCYTVCIRCSGNLNASFDWKIGDYKIYLPLSLLRALAGLACGTLIYLVYKKLSTYTYTRFAQIGGLMVSVGCFATALWLTTRLSKMPINSYSWRTLIVVLLYAIAILFVFVFENIARQKKAILIKNVFLIGGKLSMPIYMTHMLVIYVMREVMNPAAYSKKCLLFLLVGTALASALYEVCVRLLRKGCRAGTDWLKKMCLVQTAE